MVLLYMLTLSMVSLPTILARIHLFGNPKGGDYQTMHLPPRDYKLTHHPGSDYSKELEQMPPPPMKVESVKCSQGVKRTSKDKKKRCYQGLLQEGEYGNRG